MAGYSTEAAVGPMSKGVKGCGREGGGRRLGRLTLSKPSKSIKQICKYTLIMGARFVNVQGGHYKQGKLESWKGPEGVGLELEVPR